MHLFRMYWLRILKKPGAIFLWLALPFVFMTIYELSFGGDESFSVGLAVVDRDSSFVSGFIASSFDRGPLESLVDLYPAGDLAGVDRMFSRGKASAAVVIPDGFGDRLLRFEPDTLVLYRNPRHSISPQIAEGIVGAMTTIGNGALSLFHGPISELKRFSDEGRSPGADEVASIARTVYDIADDAPNLGAIASVDVKVVEEGKKQPWEFNMAAMFFPGLVAFSLLSLSLALEYRFLFDRKKKVNHRIVTAPVRPANVLFQQRLYAVVFLYVVAVGTSLIGGIVWRIPPVGLFTVNLVAIALILFITGVNGIVFGLSNSLKAVSSMSSVVMMVLLALGGGFFPIEFYPAWARAAAAWIPTGMANVAITRALTGREIGVSLPLLFAYCTLFFALSIAVGRRRVV